MARIRKLQELSDLAQDINIKIAKELGFSGKKLTTIPIPKPKVEWRHKKDIKYQQTFHRYPNRPNTEDEKAEQARMVVHDLSERLGFDPNKLNDVRFGQIYNLMKKHGHTDDAGKIFSKEKVSGGFKNLNIFGKSTGYGTPQRRINKEGKLTKLTKEERDSRKAFRQFFKRGYVMDEIGADPLSRYSRRFGSEAYYDLRKPFVDLSLKSKELTKKYEKELFDVLGGEEALAKLNPEEYVKFLNVGKDLQLLFKIDREAARKIAQFMNQFKMSVSHSFPADFAKTQSGKGVESLATRFVSKPDENLYIHPGYLNYKLSPFEHNAALKWLSGQNPTKTSEAEAIQQLGGYMKFPTGEEIGMHPLQKHGDYDKAIEEAIEIIRKSQWMKAGKPPYFNEGGLVNGYAKGGYTKQLLDDAIGMMSRRKFLKGMGATAASAAIPKGALKLAPAAVKKGAINFAPPWVNGMLSALKTAEKLPAFEARRAVMGKNFQLMGGTPVGNDAKIINMGSNKIKLYKDETATETHFKVKTGDQVMAEKLSPGFRDQEAWWDDVVLTKEKGQTTITWKNKAYQDGNDQHVVIDKISKETRFVDDNWSMEPGGGDIIKDDWVEYVMNTDKKKLAREMGLAKGDEIGESLVDEWSVKGLDNSYSGMFQSFVDSFSPSGNIFGTVAKLKNALTKPKPVTKQVKDIEEDDMMKWEEQFRGGKGMHGYSHGGVANTRDRVGEFFNPPNYRELPAQANNWLAIQGNDPWEGLSKDQSRHEKTLSFDNPQSGIRAAIISLASRAARTNKSPNLSLNQIFFEDRPWAENQGAYRKYFKDLNLPTNTIYDMSNRESLSSLINTMATLEMGKEDYNALDPERRDHIINEGIDMAYKRLIDPDYDYYSIYENKFAGGGIARRPNAVPPEKGPDPYGTLIDESVTQIMNSPSEFMGSQFIQKFNKGGFVKKNAPKVLGKLTNYKPKLTMSDVLKNVQKMKKKNTIGLTETERKAAILGDVKPEQPGAMFWGSREKIIGAPTEAMTARQWLQYLQLPKHGILNPKGYPIIKHAELNDTSLAPWLSRMGNKTLSKDVLVKQFDEMAPTMDVTVLGESTGMRIIGDLSTSLKKVDTQAIRNPAIKGFFDYVKAVMPQLKESTTDDAAKAVVKGIDDMVFNNFGVKDALTEGVPQRFPFEIKEVLQQLSTALGKRTAGFKTYKRSPEHRGTQMMEGGDNYREFLFKYKPGSLRQKEPSYEYAHSFNLSSEDRAGGIVHARTSDRADQFGRRLLHIEEIQSDMHQKINMAQRQLKKTHADWAKEGLTPEKGYSGLTKSAKKDYDNLVRDGKYAPRGDLQEEISTANEQHLLLVKAKIEDLLSQKQTPAIKTRLNRLNKERIKVRKIIDDEKKKMAQGNHSGVPLGPLSKTEDYNEFIMKYMLRVAREGGYDGITINTPAIKNLNMSSTGRDYKGNLVAYGPMAQGAMKKAAKKSGAKFMKTVIVDKDNRVWEVPMILIKENKGAQALIDKGLPVYKKGGTVKK